MENPLNQPQAMPENENVNNEQEPVVAPVEPVTETPSEEVIETESGNDPEGVVEEEVAAAEEAVEAPVATEAECIAEVAREEAADTAEAAQGELVKDEEEAAIDALPTTREGLVELAKEIAGRDGGEIRREQVARLRKAFTDLTARERAEAIALRDEAADGEEVAPAEPDAVEEEFKAALAAIKQQKSEWLARQDELKAQNLARKNEIIDQINALAADTDNVNRTYQQFSELRQTFLGVGEVPPTDETDLQRRFKDAQEKYYDQLKINKDLRDYDFRKNLEVKEQLIEQAQALTEESDVIVAFRRLQDLHAKWRETGPVAKDVREEVWNRFKDISAEINKRYQAHFEERKAQEQANELGKTAICERVEALDFSALNTFAAWDAMTTIILEAQNDWKKLGFASRKMNSQLFTRFRDTCDKFFAAKAEFFKSTKETLAANLAKKTELCEKAEALRDSEDWRKTTDALVALQKEWKTVGPVAKKHSDAIWHRFVEACDTFFDRKKKATSGVRQTEQANLKAKREIIEELRSIDVENMDQAAARARVKELQSLWSSIGHVPFKEKDKIYDSYRELTNGLYKALGMAAHNRRMSAFEASLDSLPGGDNELYRQRERLMRVLDAKRNEAQTIENNIGFFNSKTKSGDSLVRNMQQKAESLRAEVAELEKKIEAIDAKIAQ